MSWVHPSRIHGLHRLAERLSTMCVCVCILMLWLSAGAALAQPSVPAGLSGPASMGRAAWVEPAVLKVGGQESLTASELLAYIGHHADQGMLWSLDDARKNSEHFRVLPGILADGYQRQRAHWFRLRLEAGDTAPLDWWLRIGSAYLDEVQLWHIGPDGRLTGDMHRAGDRVEPLGAKVLPAPTFSIDLTAPGVHEVYLRVQTESTALIPITLMSERAAQRDLPQELLFISLLVGASFIMFLVSCGAAIWLHDRLYLLYAVFVLSNSLVWVGTSGLAHLLWFDLRPPWSDRLTSSAIALAAAVGPYLYARLLELQRSVNWVIRLTQIAGALSALAAVLPWFGWNSFWTPWVLVLVTALQVLIVHAAWRHREAMSPMARELLPPVMLLVFLTTAHALLMFGFLPAAPATMAMGPLSHIGHLGVLIWFLVRQTRLARQAASESDQRAHAAELRHRIESDAREDHANLIAMLAHEIRTPVAVIDAALQSLRILDDQAPPDRQLRHERIERALGRLSQLMDLATARDRLDVTNWTQTLDDCDLPELSREVIDILGGPARQRVQLHSAPDLRCVKADSRMLRYALLNLVDNAMKYSPAETQVEVTIEPALAATGEPGLTWTVRDRGHGIAPADAEKVFEKYYRAGETQQTAGMGLGLYLVRQIIQRHRGTVQVMPQDSGQGACIRCWLPMQPAPQKSEVSA
jgi:signal transduction histidine kinase